MVFREFAKCPPFPNFSLAAWAFAQAELQQENSFLDLSAQVATAEGTGEHVGNSGSERGRERCHQFTAAFSLADVKLAWHRMGATKARPAACPHLRFT